ncbi:MAG: TRAP transporter small permease [Proteobacteria bacterium]|nr:TRAP transporter small permease [Pseudomonadota bacterium]
MSVFLEKLGQGLGALARLMGVLAAVALSGIVVLICASTVMRYFVGASLYYTEELAGLLLSASLFLALPIVTHQSEHVRVTVLSTHLSDGGRKLLAIASAAVMLAFIAWYLREALPWLSFAMKRMIKTEASNILLWPWMMTPLLGFGLSGLIIVVQVLTGREASAIHESKPSE